MAEGVAVGFGVGAGVAVAEGVGAGVAVAEGRTGVAVGADTPEWEPPQPVIAASKMALEPRQMGVEKREKWDMRKEWFSIITNEI